MEAMRSLKKTVNLGDLSKIGTFLRTGGVLTGHIWSQHSLAFLLYDPPPIDSSVSRTP